MGPIHRIGVGLFSGALNTVTVSGSCHGNILIQGFDRLTLITTTRATINDASGGQSPVVDIEDSRRVNLEGFTIRGGARGVNCRCVHRNFQRQGAHSQTLAAARQTAWNHKQNLDLQMIVWLLGR